MRMSGGTSRDYEILGVRVALWGDCQDFLDHYRLQYGAFETHPRPIPEADVRAQFLSTGPTLVLNGRKTELPCISHPFEEAQSLIWEEVASRVTDFHLLHGAVLVRDGGALVISGPPGSGKTTLALALAKKGWTLYSDEMAPLHRGSGLIHPFPRAIHVRREREAETEAKVAGQDQPALSKECIAFPVSKKGFPPAPWKVLFLIGALERPSRERHILHVTVRDPEGRFYGEALRVAGTSGEILCQKRGFRHYRLVLPKTRDATESFMALRRRWGAEIVQMARVEEGRYEFGHQAECKAVPLDQAFLLLVGGLKALWTGKTSATMLLADLAQHMEQVRVTALRVGALEETVSMVERWAARCGQP